MQIDYFLSNRHLKDLNPILAGEESCKPGHSFGPFMRWYTLIHYVVKGCGIFCARGQTFHVHAGEAFLILPGEVTTYTADMDDPWHYQWIGFTGELSAAFAELPAVFQVPADIFPRIVQAASAQQGAEYLVSSVLFRLYAEMFMPAGGSNRHVQKVESFIQARYMENISVELIAHQMNLDRRYLTRLFKAKTGKTIQEYLIEVRLKQACDYLRQGFSVNHTASLCGYEDVSNFSRMFKKRYGLSPQHWQNKAKSAR